jgi:hypothetical protein
MAGHARYTALFDACVLYPLAMTDALMSLATAGLFAAKWTTKIVHEWIRALERQRPDLVGRLTTRRDSMRAAVPDWEIHQSAWGPLAFGIVLPDPDTFILNQWDLDHVSVITAFKHMRERRKKPSSGAEEFAYAIEIGGLPATAERLRAARDLI